MYTQVEIVCGNEAQVWWFPISNTNSLMGEVVERKVPHTNLGHYHIERWVVTQVCVTLDESAIPKGARIARTFEKPEIGHTFIT